MKHTLENIREIYNLPITTLMFRAQQVHQEHQDPAGVQLSQLQSIKTGACPEDCKYCPQSGKYSTHVEPERLMNPEDVLRKAKEAKAAGASRLCMGAAWRNVPSGKRFETVKDTIRTVAEEGLEVCMTMGMMTEEQAKEIYEAGCTVYNHNLDTSPEYYKEIISTRTYEDRLTTLANARKAGLEVCTGGIVGMGEKVDDRLGLLQQLANMEPQPESVPINALVACKGTPLEDQPFVDPFEFVRIIATARILMPHTIVRLSAGRTQMSDETQALCFIAGANSIFMGDKLLTTPNPEKNEDMQLLNKLGLHPLDPQAQRRKRRLAQAEAEKAATPEPASV